MAGKARQTVGGSPPEGSAFGRYAARDAMVSRRRPYGGAIFLSRLGVFRYPTIFPS